MPAHKAKSPKKLKLQMPERFHFKLVSHTKSSEVVVIYLPVKPSLFSEGFFIIFGVIEQTHGLQIRGDG
jgi:hypothetical protein